MLGPHMQHKWLILSQISNRKPLRSCVKNRCEAINVFAGNALLMCLSGTLLLHTDLASAQTRDGQGENREAVAAMLACRQMADQTARLACFDDRSGQLEASLQQGRTVVVDRAQVIEDQRQRFGQARRDPDEKVAPIKDESLDEVSGKVSSAVRDGEGRWTVVLADGARWRQIDSTLLGRTPKAGSPVTIKRAALGSFKMSVESGPAFKVRRIN